MTARLLPSHRAVSRLEAAAYDVIDDVLDVLQQVEGRDATAAMSTEALLLWRRQWQDALRKRSASDAQKITWRRFIADADAVLMWALLSVRPAYPAQVAAVDPCPILAVQLESGYVQMLNCSKFFPYLEVRR